MKNKTNCDCCTYYSYDDEYSCYECRAALDEDEMGKFLSNSYEDCPYFRLDDEYKTVRKQM